MPVDLWQYVENLKKLVDDLLDRLTRSQNNLKTIENLLQSWSGTPILERKDGKKDTMLDLDGREEKFKKRFAFYS